jgi:putative restriction endonuclease
MTIEKYIYKFLQIKQNKNKGRERPHKVCMLLAVLDMAKAGGLQENKIFLRRDRPELIERYTKFFNVLSIGDEKPNPHYPFMYLGEKLKDKTPSFWHWHSNPGKEAELKKARKADSFSAVEKNINFVSLDPELFDLLSDLKNIEILENSLAQYCKEENHVDIDPVLKASGAISDYERNIRSGKFESLVVQEIESIRSPAFRRVVTKNYDYRCAATGVRILLPTGVAMVEAAHIHPFSEARDDDPKNGLALTPNMHWAMDKNLIAPGPDNIWHVSKVLDKRIPDFRMLIELEGMPLLMPNDLKFAPKKEALAWRLERLMESE